jgi:hypothetical protein
MNGVCGLECGLEGPVEERKAGGYRMNAMLNATLEPVRRGRRSGLVYGRGLLQDERLFLH